MEIYSAVISDVVPAGFADLAEAAERLPGLEVTEARTRLKVHGRAGTGFAGAIRFSGTLQTAALLPSIKVEVVVSPWSAGRTEVAIQPMTNLGHLDSLRAARFFKAARSVLPLVIDRLFSELPVEVPAPARLAA